MAHRRDPSRRLLGFARVMRHEAMDAERRMWGILRGRRLQGFKFRRQYPIAGYILDFYCIRHRLAVELDGSQYMEARQMEYDQRRTETLAAHGIRVLRFWDNDVLKVPDVVAETVYNELMKQSGSA